MVKNSGTSRVRLQKVIEHRLSCWASRQKALEKMLREVGNDEKRGLSIDISRLKTIEAEGQRCLSVVEAAGAEVWGRLQADFVDRWDRVNRAAEDIWTRAK